MESDNVDVHDYLAKWTVTKLGKYKPHGVSAKTFESALKELFVAVHRDSATPASALGADDTPQDVLDVALQLGKNRAVVATIANDLAALKQESRKQGDTRTTTRQRAVPDNRVVRRVEPGDAPRKAKAAALGAVVRALHERQSEQSAPTEQSYADRRQRSSSWLAKALRVDDPIDLESRFLFSWIALNSLYGVPRSCLDCVSVKPREKQKQDHDDLLWFIDAVCRLDSDEERIWNVVSRNAMTIDAAADDSFLLRGYWEDEDRFVSDAQLEQRKLDDKKTIADARRAKDPIRILHLLLVYRLRTLRNQLIHGAATDGPYSRRRENNEEDFKRQVGLLEQLVELFLLVMKAEGSRINWPCIPDPRLGSAGHRRRTKPCPLNANQSIGKRSRSSESRRSTS